MSYTTRCPACGTTFRVVPDQLKISDGWVRCGYCSDVFDATINLQDWPAQQVEPAPAGPSAGTAPVPEHASGGVVVDEAPGSVAAPVPEPEPEPEPEDAGWQDEDFLTDLHRYAQRVRGTAAEVDPDPAPPPPPAPAPMLAERPLASPTSGRAPPSAPMRAPVVPVPDTERTVAPPADPDPADTAPPPRGDEAPALPDFVVQARRRAFWSSPGVRAVLLLLVLALTGLLLSQWVWHERDQVAARWPAARPLLQSVCAKAGCEIAPVRRIDDVVIDSSHLARRLGSFYVFDLVLRNKADVPVAMPALELSLTGPRNDLLARRVFLPRELPGTPVVVPARGSLDLTLSLSISLAETGAMSGYQAVLFYP